MNRLTRTKLEKLLYIHDCRVDQIVEAACSELDDIIDKPIRKPKLNIPSRREELHAINTRLTALERGNAFNHPQNLWMAQQQAAAAAAFSGMNTQFALIRFYNPLQGVING